MIKLQAAKKITHSGYPTTSRKKKECCQMVKTSFIYQSRDKTSFSFSYFGKEAPKASIEYIIQAVIVSVYRQYYRRRSDKNEEKIDFSYQSFGKQAIKTAAETNHEKGRESGKMQFVFHHG